VEVLSNQDVSEYERAVTICPDAYRTICGVASQPSELGVGKQHTYYFQQCLSKIRDVYGPRPWQERAPPATLCTLQGVQSSTRSPANETGTTEYLSLIERMPLSKEGYDQLSEDFLMWKKYQSDREGSSNVFHVADNRPLEELQAEDSIKKRLKAAYKAARANKYKNKKLEKADRNSKGVPEELALGVQEQLVEGDDDDGGDFSDDSGDEIIHMDVNEAEIRAAFDSYAKVPDKTNQSIELLEKDGLIHSCDLQSAFIQLMNCHVSQDDVNQALLEEGYQNIGNCLLALEDFRFLYRIMQEMNTSNNQTPGGSSWDRRLNADLSDDDDSQTSHNYKSYSPLSHDAIDAHNKNNRDVSPLSMNNNAFWRSPTGTYEYI
jgi:hypothetical protein